jgi:hypothetical protein
LLRRALVQAQQKKIVRRCIGLLRNWVLGAAIAAWGQRAATQRSLRERLQAAETKRRASSRRRCCGGGLRRQCLKPLEIANCCWW